ncbi:NAD-dependent epimerase/dehydratase family protein [Streptomyces sp. NPDC006197]|uniref:NAD-dependent epimerase/dehydratase family protein n=1 Tax=Streptomyces sp. NPDC006197 TaxID=3156685 RepID=UPI0033A91BB5
MRVLVAGATGAVGRQLVPRPEAAGHEVVGISRRGPRPVDALDAEAVRRAVAGIAPDAVVHRLTDLGGLGPGRAGHPGPCAGVDPGPTVLARGFADQGA